MTSPSRRLPLLPLLALLLAAVAPLVDESAGPWLMAAAFTVLVGSVLAIAWRLAARLLPDAQPAVFLLGAALLAEAIPAAAVGVLGSFGAFRLPLVLVLLGGAGFAAHRCGGPQRSPASIVTELAERRVAVLAAFALLLLAAMCGLAAMNQLRFTVQDADSMWYHLPMAGEWVRTGSIAPIEAVPLIGRAYPGFRQAILAFLSLPAGNEHLALLGIAELPMLAGSVYAVARHFGAARALALAAGVYVAATPVVVGAYSTQGNDLAVAINLLLAILFTSRAVGATAAGRAPGGDALLAGVALGALAATKFSGPAYAVAIVGTAALQHGVRRALDRRVSLPLCGSALLLAGPWFLRNLLWFHNPMYPARIAVAGHELFAGPLGPDYFAPMGFHCAPLFAKWQQFPEAHGPLVAVGALGPLLALAGARGKEGRRGILAMVVLPIALFLAFLQHPFNEPGFDASYVHRYLVGWFACSMAAAAVGLSRWPRVATAAAVLLLAAAATTGLASTHAAPVLVAGALLGAAALAWPPLQHVARRAAATAASLHAPAFALVLLAIPATYGLQSFRARSQYDPDYGYRDPVSERGWGPAAAWVHRHVHGRRVGLCGSIYFFPLIGEPFCNEVFVADDLHLDLPRKTPAEIADWAERLRLDYLVCCVPRAGRTASREFQFGESVAPALLADYREQFESVFASRGTQVLAVMRR